MPMRDRFNRLVLVTMALTMLAIGAYLASVYATSTSADQAADFQNERVVLGLLEARAERTLDMVERLARSDTVFRALQQQRPENALEGYCGQTSETKLKSIGTLSAELSMSYLCEYGDEKAASEQSYLIQFLEPYAQALLVQGQATIQQRGVLKAAFIYDQQYTSFAGVNYILTLALVTPDKETLGNLGDLHILFSLENIDRFLSDVTSEFLKLELVDITGTPTRSKSVHVAKLKRKPGDAGLSIAWSRSDNFRQHMWYLGPMLLAIVFVAGFLMVQSLHRIQALHADLVKREARSRYEAQHDQMTGLLNRKYFYERLDGLLSKATADAPVFVGIFDLDRFKSVNDTYGHHAGDMLILETAHRLVSVLRDENIAARLGGDEFAFAIRTCPDTEAARSVLDRLLIELKREVWVEGLLIQPSASIGVAVAPIDSRSRDILLKKADAALYEVKKTGRGAIKFFSSTQTAKFNVIANKQTDELVA